MTGATLYAIWCQLTGNLTEWGWTPEELSRDAMIVAATHESEGTA
jgi:hypothetical protein